jgi:hypothetical protein
MQRNQWWDTRARKTGRSLARRLGAVATCGASAKYAPRVTEGEIVLLAAAQFSAAAARQN